MKICVKELGYVMVILLGQFTFGMIMCYPSPTGEEIRRIHHLSDKAAQWSFYNSVSSLFAIAGPFVTSGLLRSFHNSRRTVVFTLACAAVVFWLLNCLTKINIWAGIVMRAFLGIIMGSFSTVDPMYIVEISPKELSGFFGSLNQIGNVTGMIFSDFIGPSLNYLELNYVGAATAALHAGLTWVIIESPVVEKLNKEEEMKENEHEKKKVTLCQKKNMFGLFSGIEMMIIQQFCGINAILTNLADLMNKSGLEMDGNYQGGIASIAQFIAVFISALIIDKIGRKTTWIISCSIIVVFLLIYALNTKFNWSTILPIVCIFLYQLGFGLGIGPIPWFLIPEYFDDDVRSIATSIVVASNWISAFIIIFVWPTMDKSMGMFGALLFFMFVAVAGVIFGVLVIKEPKKQKPQDQIEKTEMKEEEKKTEEEELPESL